MRMNGLLYIQVLQRPESVLSSKCLVILSKTIARHKFNSRIENARPPRVLAKKKLLCLVHYISTKAAAIR